MRHRISNANFTHLCRILTNTRLSGEIFEIFPSFHLLTYLTTSRLFVVYFVWILNSLIKKNIINWLLRPHKLFDNMNFIILWRLLTQYLSWVLPYLHIDLKNHFINLLSFITFLLFEDYIFLNIITWFQLT